MVVTDSGHRYDIQTEDEIVRTYKRMQTRRKVDKVLVWLAYVGVGAVLGVVIYLVRWAW